MALKKAETFKNIDLPSSYHEIIHFRGDKLVDEEGNKTWRVILRVAFYSDSDKTEMLETPPREYVIGPEEYGEVMGIEEAELTFNDFYTYLKLIERFDGMEDC